MIVVADTSPLSNLHGIGRLALVQRLFGEVIVPPLVAEELADPAGPFPLDVRVLPWIRVVGPQTAYSSVRGDVLDEGEVQAIAVALEVAADRILVDDLEARVEARRLGLRVLGLLGVLVMAKLGGLLSSVRDVIEELQAKTSFRMSTEIIDEVLRKAGEA